MLNMISCKTCGKEISKRAKACPNCGETANKTHIVTKIVLVIAVLWAIGLMLPETGPSPSPASSTPKAKGAPHQVASTQKPNNWTVSRSKSEMTDSPTVYVSTLSQNEYTHWLGTPSKVSFAARCAENRTDVILNTNSRFNVEYGQYEMARIRYRINDNKPVVQYWAESTNGESAFSPNPIKLLKELKDADTLTVEFIPFNSNTATVKFDISGFAQYVEEIAKTCNWKL